MMRRIGFVLLLFGSACLVWYGAQVYARVSFQRNQNAAFDTALSKRNTERVARRIAPHSVIGRLEIPRLHVKTVVVEGDDEQTLQRAVGHLPDTPLPWERGNSAVAGHRDTFFRALRNVRSGDEIRFTTAHGQFVYRVRETQITSPDDMEVLDAGPTPALTLVTCYPFTYLGSAPDRYIVRAEREVSASPPSAAAGMR